MCSIICIFHRCVLEFVLLQGKDIFQRTNHLCKGMVLRQMVVSLIVLHYTCVVHTTEDHPYMSIHIHHQPGRSRLRYSLQKMTGVCSQCDAQVDNGQIHRILIMLLNKSCQNHVGIEMSFIRIPRCPAPPPSITLTGAYIFGPLTNVLFCEPAQSSGVIKCTQDNTLTHNHIL